MKKPTDSELDQLFKAAAEGFQPPADISAWDTMQQKLDNPTPVFWKQWMTYTGLGLVIFSAGIWVGIQLAVNEDKMGKANQEDKTPGVAEINKENSELLSSQKSTQDKQSFEVKPEPIRLAGESNKNKARDLALLNTEKEQPANYPNAEISNQSEFHLIQVSKPQIFSIDSVAAENSITAQEADSVNLENASPRYVNHRGLFVRVLASPDLSSIGFGKVTEIGGNVAFLFDYQISDRWSFGTGIIGSRKKYTAGEAVYHGYPVNSLDGNCQVLDFPITLRYFFKAKGKTAWSIATGVSSYFMLQEEYTYTVSAGYGSGSYTTQYEKENNEWFKILNFSIGLHHQVAPRWTIESEPFVKIPLAGLGAGDVDLSSLGLFLGVKYKITK